MAQAQSSPAPFKCSNCGADYKVVHTEIALAPESDTPACVICDAVLPSSEGNLVLKYFLVGPSRRRGRRAAKVVKDGARS